MIAPRRNLFGRWSWAKTTSVVINMGVAAFVVACLMSSWSLARRRLPAQEKHSPPQRNKTPKQQFSLGPHWTTRN